MGDKVAFRGRRSPRDFLITGPQSQVWRAVFFEAFDHLRFYIPQSVMVECYEAAFGKPATSSLCLLDLATVNDRQLTYLSRAIRQAAHYGHMLGPCFLDALGQAIASRLVTLFTRPRFSKDLPRQHALPQMRLKEVIEFIDAHLAAPIHLASLCDVVGLTRVNFAAQFRAATGLPPYAFILRRKVLFAQQLLRNPSHPIADVALTAGFCSQAHFTGVFRKIVGETPARWRKLVA